MKSLLLLVLAFSFPGISHAEFRVGATVVDVTPNQLPVIVNGGMFSRTVGTVNTRLNARAFALADGKEQLAIVVVDNCMMPREFLDEVKKLASDATGIRPDRILISATHAHSAGSVEGCLGSDPDPNYVVYLRGKLVEAIQKAQANLEPASIGFGKINAKDFTALRRWIRRPDRIAEDPFGNKTLRANMHAGRNWDDAVGESGPEDPDLSLIAFRSKEGRPLGVLANFSMHYFGDKDISADYYGRFSEGLKARIAPKTQPGKTDFVGAMSHGCSGDIYRIDYTAPDAPQNKHTIESFTNGLLDLAMEAYSKIEYRDDAEINMTETRVPLNYRLPDKQRLEWANRIVESYKGRLPKDTTEVYAREQILLDEWKSTSVVVQAIKLGDVAIATTPCETYALTGLKVKLQSPLPNTIVIELANGGDGYIPPPEQHLLGGYNTWPARSAGLEVQAEPKIAATALSLLQQVCGKPRKTYRQSNGPSVAAIQKLKPAAYYRLDEFAGPRAQDSSGNHLSGIYEPHVAYFLEGPLSEKFCENGETNRSVHFTGERLRTTIPELGDHYSVSLWIWNGMPVDGRDVTGWFLSRGEHQVLSGSLDHLGIGGKSDSPGKLIYRSGDRSESVAGKTEIPRWTWAQVTFVRDGEKIKVYLNGNPTPEIETTASTSGLASLEELFLGGRCDNESNWEGRLDEIALFNRSLNLEEVQSLSR